MKTFQRVFLVVIILLPGCAGFDAAQSGIAERGAAISDEARQTAQWTLCSAISVGAWRRAYGNNPEKAAAWKTLCSDKVEQTP